MHHTHSALHRPRAAHRRRAQAQPAFRGGVSRSSRTGSGIPRAPRRTTTVSLKPLLSRHRLRPPQSCLAVLSRTDANRRREGLTPQQIRQGTRLKAYQQHPGAPARYEEEERYHTACPALGA